MSRISHCPEERDSSHAIVVDQVARVDEQPGVDNDQITPVEATVGWLKEETFIVQAGMGGSEGGRKGGRERRREEGDRQTYRQRKRGWKEKRSNNII